MKKFFFLVFLISFCSVSLPSQGADIIFKERINPANYVKLENFKSKNETLHHPYSFTEEQLRGILRSIRFSKKLIIYKNAKNRDLFSDDSVDQYFTYLIEAFQKATPKQAVIWSVVQKNPYIILRNDRLTQVRMWVVGQEMHFDFVKIDAKLEGDYQAPVVGERIIDQSRGIGVRIEPQVGQKFAIDSSDELILDLNQDWVAIANLLDAEDQKLSEKSKGKAKSETASSSGLDVTPTPASTLADQRRAQERLTELKQLQDKGLITEKDYEKKKEEILKGL